VTVATDEIYEKYLQKAITEINALGDEVAQAGAGTRVPVVGSGHPLAVYGTNALKFADGDETESRPFLLRELHIVQPKLVVAMGERALVFLNSVAFPLARELAPVEGELQSFTPTIDALFTPDIDDSLDEQPDKTRFWNAFKLLGEWWASQPPY
jgi:uracil-DNA glycosylase